MAGREEILADFQAFTGIEDVEEAIMQLEDSNWDLMSAVHRVLPQGSQELPTHNHLPSLLDDSVQVIEPTGPMPLPLPAQAFESATASSSSAPPMFAHLVQPRPLVSVSADYLTNRSRARILSFTILWNGVPTELMVPEDQPVLMIKNLIYSQLGVPVCKQELVGWKLDRPPRDGALLESLNLPTKDNTLYLNVQQEQRQDATDDLIRLTSTYKLVIFDDTHQRLHSVNFPGSKTLAEIKRDVFDLTNIAVRHQFWTGWPPALTDDTILGASGVQSVQHLTVSEVKRETNSRTTGESSSSSTAPVDPSISVRPLVTVGGGEGAGSGSEDGVSSDDEFEDTNDVIMDDDMFIREIIPSRPQPLMPEGMEDEAMAAIHFAEGFSLRYGHCHPMFFQGSLDDAMREAVMQPARNRKLLAVYLHHDGSVSSNVFCTQVLCSESVVSFLSSNFVIWGWDLTMPTNRQQLYNMIARHFDSLASRTLRNFDVDRLPLLLIVTRSRATNEILAMVPGSLNVDEMMTQLIQSVEMFSEQQRVEVAEEEERFARETVKREQDEAYQLSLEADRAKQEAKRQNEADKQRIEEEKRVLDQQAKLEVEFAEKKKEERRLAVKENLPPEPEASSDVATGTTTIRFRLPGGKTSIRRFLAQQSLQILLDFLLVEGYPVDEFKVLSSFPRKDLTAVDTTQTLRQLNLVPQETLIIEER